MEKIIYLILVCIILIFTGIKAKRHINDIKKCIPILLIGLTISLTVLVYPLIEASNIVSKIVFSIIYAAQTIILNEDISIINSIETVGIVNIIYIGLMYIHHLLMPLLTVSFLLSLINDFTSKIKLLFNFNKKVVIFSNINEKSITIAESLDNKNITMLFANYNKEEENGILENIKEANIIKYTKSLENINLNSIRSKDITCYILSNDSDKDLDITLSLIEKYKQKNIKIYLITNTDLPRIILDSTDKGNIQLEIVNEIERTVYNLLDRKPLYLHATNNIISVLIVGTSKMAKEFLKTVTWCGQLIGYKLKISIIDINANKLKEELLNHNKELIENYDYNFVTADINSSFATLKLNELAKTGINYCIVALDSDEENINTAIFLRRFFLREDKENFSNMPIINAFVQSDLKSNQINVLKNEKNNSYNINAFGSIRQMYLHSSIINSNIEKLAKKVHLSYNPDDTKLIEYYKLEYNVRSSRATALHIKYKIYSILKDNFKNNLKEDLKLFEELLNNKDVIKKLSKNEHDRWMAYMRADGYNSASVEDVKKYVFITNDYRHHLAKLHPALTEYENLEEIENVIKKDLKKSDEDIIKSIPQILK